MSLPAWPATVPAPQREDLRRVPISTMVRRRTQSGRQEGRRFGAAVPDRIEGPILLTPDEYDDLVAFWEDDCDLGTGWFTADWIVLLGYTSSHAGRILGYPQLDGQTGVRKVQLTMLIQHQDNI